MSPLNGKETNMKKGHKTKSNVDRFIILYFLLLPKKETIIAGIRGGVQTIAHSIDADKLPTPHELPSILKDLWIKRNFGTDDQPHFLKETTV
ncbi:hypothetical protein NPIL_306411 [Nephila pilipes]|uniref:Uncharacterized protein n=1 Tax=Nephila pilipes TaxID=299642 RepID=A0A8X6ULS8_NEPPI|nr:hypothetical protein NPIL_306411 [Nephila pilipes]